MQVKRVPSGRAIRAGGRLAAALLAVAAMVFAALPAASAQQTPELESASMRQLSDAVNQSEQGMAEGETTEVQRILTRVPTVAPTKLGPNVLSFIHPLVPGDSTPCIEGQVCMFYYRMALDPGDWIVGRYDVHVRTDDSDPWVRLRTPGSARSARFVGGDAGDWTDWRIGYYFVPSDDDIDDTFVEFRIGAGKKSTLVYYEPDPDFFDPDEEPELWYYPVWDDYTATVTATALDPDAGGQDGQGDQEQQFTGEATGDVDDAEDFVVDAELLAAVVATADSHANPKAERRLRKVAAGMSGQPSGYTAAECRAVAARHGVKKSWRPWCDEIERREAFESTGTGSAPTLEERIRERLEKAKANGDATSRDLWRRALATIGVGNAKPLGEERIERFISNHERAGRTDLAQLWQDILDAAV